MERIEYPLFDSRFAGTWLTAGKTALREYAWTPRPHRARARGRFSADFSA
jgi:hypothetical protein